MMNPKLAGSWRSTAFQGYRRSTAENMDQDPTRAVLKPRDLNRDFSHDVYPSDERFDKFNYPRTRSRKRTVKESSSQHVYDRDKYIEEIAEEDWKRAASENYIGQDASDVEESEAHAVPDTEYVDQISVPTYADAVLELRVVNRNRDRDVSVPALVRVRKPRFARIKSRKQKKQSKPKKEEPTYDGAIEGPPLALESLQKPRENRTCFTVLAEEFALSEECCAMMVHLDLNTKFERMSYTLMLKK